MVRVLRGTGECRGTPVLLVMLVNPVRPGGSFSHESERVILEYLDWHLSFDIRHPHRLPQYLQIVDFYS